MMYELHASYKEQANDCRGKGLLSQSCGWWIIIVIW